MECRSDVEWIEDAADTEGAAMVVGFLEQGPMLFGPAQRLREDASDALIAIQEAPSW